MRRFIAWLLAESRPVLLIRSAEGRTVPVPDKEYREGRERLLAAGMYNVRGRGDQS